MDTSEFRQCLTVACFKKVAHLLVLTTGSSRHVRITDESHPVAVALVPQSFEHLGEGRIAGGRVDRPVELAVVCKMVKLFPAYGRQQASDLADLARRHAIRSKLRRVRVEQH